MGKRMKTIGKSILLFVATVLMCLGFVPLFQNLNFGLDLQGGFEVLYQVSSIDKSKMNQEKMTATYKSMSKRIDLLGVSEPEIILEGTDKIRVKLAGVTDQETAREQLSTVASLTFRDTNDNLLMTSDVLKAGASKLTQDNSGNPAVLLSIRDKDKFFEVTNKVKDYENNRIVIWLDFEEGKDSYSQEQSSCGTSESNCLSAATVDEGFASDVIIQGNFTQEDAQNLVDLINSGSLPTKLTEISSKTVGASFGDATLERTLLAGIIGVTLIIILLIALYHFAGFLSAVSVLLYTFLVFLTFWVVGGVLTLPGIAALVLGIGMAVDANVIMYARIKEELYRGKSLKTAFKLGSKASFKTILDSNLTTLLVAVIMFIFGESSVKGFATMLIITIAVTMFTMVFITRQLLKLFVKDGYFDDKLYFFLRVDKDDCKDIKDTKTEEKAPRDYLKIGRYFIGFSCLVFLTGVLFFGMKGMHLGIDYQAGSNVTIETDAVLTNKNLKQDFKKLDLEVVQIEEQSSGKTVRVKNVLERTKVNEVNQYFEEKYQAKVNIEVVSNVVKQELARNAIFSILLSLIGIIIYVSFRFQFSYGVGAVSALLHDAFLMVAVFAITQLEISVMFIAAVLAIIGYSINNTIVVFDRIREEMSKVEMRKMTKEKLRRLTNRAIQQMMLRTIYTSVTTLLPVLALIFLGSHEIFGFNIAMLVGLIAGTYSSIFLAPTIWYHIEKRKVGKEEKKKKVYHDDLEEKLIKGINA